MTFVSGLRMWNHELEGWSRRFVEREGEGRGEGEGEKGILSGKGGGDIVS